MKKESLFYAALKRGGCITFFNLGIMRTIYKLMVFIHLL